MGNERKYELNIDARILQLLGPNLYTNIYYVLAEIIANSYDADAKNVYICFRKDAISIEDDGIGMSYESGDIGRYLEVGKESRRDSSSSYTRGGRLKMGRKGIGKLAALSISDRVMIQTISESGERSGFILSAIDVHDNVLPSIPQNEITLSHGQLHGTLVRMQDPKLKFHKTPEVVKKNLAKLFPVIGKDFVIHIDLFGKKCSMTSYGESLDSELAALITLGDNFRSYFKKFSAIDKSLENRGPARSLDLSLQTKDLGMRDYILNVEGWIGSYKSSRSKKQGDFSDFPENYISLLANGKVGEFNILPLVGSNRLSDVYIVGQLHVDLFEHSDLPDMALSNRQGYQSEDDRYRAVIQYVRDELVPQISRMREQYTKIKKRRKGDNAKPNGANESKGHDVSLDEFSSKASPKGDSVDDEDLLYDDILKDELKQDFISSLEEKMASNANFDTLDSNFSQVAGDAFEDAILDPRIKVYSPSDDRKILISHTSKDKDLADIIYNMLVFNNVPEDSIIYTSCDNEVSRIRQGQNIYGYLKDEFFAREDRGAVRYVIFVTSERMGGCWGAVAEVGAAWISGSEHSIFNVPPFAPKKPLDSDSPWVNCSRNGEVLTLNSAGLDTFAARIETIARRMKQQSRSRDQNKKELKRYFTVK